MATYRVQDTDALKKAFTYFCDGMLYAFHSFEEIRTKISGVDKYDTVLVFQELDSRKNPTGVYVKVHHGTFLKAVTTLQNDNGVAKALRRNVPIYTGTIIDAYKLMWQKCVTYGEWKEGVTELFKDLMFTCVVTNHTERIRTYDFENKVWIKTYDDSKNGWTSYVLDWVEGKPATSKRTK